MTCNSAAPGPVSASPPSPTTRFSKVAKRASRARERDRSEEERRSKHD